MVHMPTRKPHLLPPHKDVDSPARFISSFFFRSICVGFFILLLPLFPSQAPDFLNQTVFTRSWELLHLLLVGIAVSYGVFSRRNVDGEKDGVVGGGYAPKMLQVSSVFDEDGESCSGGMEQSKVQAWSSRYSRGEPVVVVSEDTAASTNERPLLLPVRSLRSRVYDAGMADGVEDDKDGSFSDGEGVVEGSEKVGVEEEEPKKAMESVVLPSPIPWRSRSSSADPDFDLLDPPSPSIRPRKGSSAIASPKKLSPSPSLSPDFDGGEGVVKRRSSLPPPPPPPPPPFFYRSRSAAASDRQGKRRSLKEDVKQLNRGSKENHVPSSMGEGKDLESRPFKLDSSSNNGGHVSIKKGGHDVGSRSFRLDSSSANSGGHVSMKKGDHDVGSRSFRLDSPSSINGGSSVRKSDQDVGNRSFNTRAKHSNEDPSMGRSGSWGGSKDVNVEFETLKPGTKNKHIGEGLSIGKSVRTVRASNGDGFEMYNGGYKNKVVDDDLVDLVPEIKVGFDQQRKETPLGKYSESEESDAENSDDEEKEEVAVAASVADDKQDENEVDRKADEFIAKFREQIRLQRIESIKKTASQRAKSIAS